MNKSIFILSFVLLIGFPQVSSGEGLNLFGRSGDDVLIHCGKIYSIDIYVVNLKQKTIKHFKTDKGVHITYEITEVSEVYVKGRNTTHKEGITIWRFGLEVGSNMVSKVNRFKLDDNETSILEEKCLFVESNF